MDILYFLFGWLVHEGFDEEREQREARREEDDESWDKAQEESDSDYRWPDA